MFEALCSRIGHKVALVVNYDGFRLDETLTDAYFEMVSELQAKYYTHGGALHDQRLHAHEARRGTAVRHASAHVFETHAEAAKFQQRASQAVVPAAA